MKKRKIESYTSKGKYKRAELSKSNYLTFIYTCVIYNAGQKPWILGRR